MKQENIEMEEQVPTIGQSLHTARIASGMSVEDVSQRLKLTALQVTKLEQDDYQDLGPVTFIRGYIKSYSNLLGLDSQQLLALMDAPKAPEPTKRMQSFSRRTEKEASDNRLMIFSYLILALVIGSSGVWYWQTSDSAPEAKPQSSSNSLATETVERESAANAVGAIVTQDDSLNDNSELNQTELVALSDITKHEQVTLAEDATQQEQLKQELDVLPIEEQKDADLSTIVMRFSDDSWVEIFDATQERIAFGVKKAGYTMTVEGKAPFNVVLGKHQVVAVELDGQLIDLSSLPRNRLAKFNLPLAE
ncbi:membrane protein [Pseudoalteromonas sp. A25]|uniref:RodZ domain-containing protein n=1 Tax=Pseudoalteromonas sp. A25 TaxID=116092 RepID=UPI001260A7CD|nr:RodZ domain-containing protein [Pseudoalteromonas sp. A25]BBN80600.1 membrane protein [Pseudoalteromonas sp. A25]